MLTVTLTSAAGALIRNGVTSMLLRRRSATVQARFVGFGHHDHEFLAAVTAGEIDSANVFRDAARDSIRWPSRV